jgi:hypothetical protein
MDNADKIFTEEWLKEDVVTIPNFLSADECQRIIDFFEDQGKEYWMQTCFYDSLGMALVSDEDALLRSGLEEIHPDYFRWLPERIKSAVEQAYSREVKLNSAHAQKWPLGAFARWHSDSSDLEGNPTAWRDNKFASVLYLNDNYDGGELEFRDHDLTVKLPQGSLIAFPGGVENIHRINEILAGTRFTIVGFWDYADSVYTEEEMAQREAEITFERERQAQQKLEWAAGNKDA